MYQDDRLRDFLRGHKGFTALLKFSAIGAALMGIQIALQALETSHGWNILLWSPLQGTALANVGLVLNKRWTFKERQLPWLGIIICWNIQKIPHSLLSWGIFALFLQVPFMAYWMATLSTAVLLGLFSFWLANKWSLRGRELEPKRRELWAR